MLKAKSSGGSPKICQILTFLGAGDQGVGRVAIFTAKDISLRENTSFEPFCVKVRLGV